VLTVICPPLFSDYLRTHQALRELAVALAGKGQHVLRFDYRGTGDSSGELEEATVADWLEDIARVVQEGREISQCKAVRVLGVRAGALFACKALGTSPAVQRLVLWDPLLDGAAYLQALRLRQAAVCARNLYLGRAVRREALRDHAGYVLSDRMVEELRALDASAYAGIPAARLNVVGTSADAGFPVRDAPLEVAPFRCNWDAVTADLIVPRPVLERLVACLTRP
jgi:alpha-beta hydrolase superfamily lysophospholipase